MIATLLSVAVISRWVWVRSDPVPPTWHTLRAGWTEAIRRGLRALVAAVLTLLLVRCDIWMLGPFVGVDVVGQMSVAMGLAEWLWYVPLILGNVLFAAVAANADLAVRQICRASRAVVTVIVPVAVGLIFVGRQLVPLIYGRQYEPAGLLFVILVPGMSAVAMHIVVDSLFAGRGFPPISIWSAFGALAAKIALNLMVVPRYGAVGAASVTVAVYVGLLTVKVVAFSRTTRTPVAAILRPSRADVVANIATVRAWLRERLGFVAGRTD